MSTSTGVLLGKVIGLWAPEALRPTIQEVVRQAGGRKVIAIREGADPVEIVLTRDVDILLVDETAVDPDPLALVEGMARRVPTANLPRTALMTSEPTRTKLEASLAAGYGVVIAKPFSARTLISSVTRLMQLDAMRDSELPDRIFLD